MSRISKLRLIVLAVTLFSPLTHAQQRISPEEAAAQQAQQQRALAEGGIAHNRSAAIETLVRFWQNALPSHDTRSQFQATLQAASNKTLARIFGATSFEQVRSILLGRTATPSTSGGFTIANLGDVNNDLTFTPVNPPCRIFDTRNYGDRLPPTGGTQRNYQVHGDGATIGAQGGNSSGCPAPKGEPVAIAVNITAVPSQTSHLRVFPFGGTLPTVSWLSFQAGQAISNAGIVSTCFLCASDLTVYNAAQTHHVGDVMGYFYPVSMNDPALGQVKATGFNSGDTHASTLVNDLQLHFVGPTVTHTIAAGDVVYMTANHYLGTGSVAASGLFLHACRQASTATNPSGVGEQMDNGRLPANTRISWGVNGVFSGLAAGTYQFGMCYATNSTNWNSHNAGRVSTMVVNPLP